MKNNNLVSSAKVYEAYAEFTTLFRIPFKEGSVECNPYIWQDLLGSWAEVCIKALEMRIDACVSMLFRNRDNIIISNEDQVVFKKSNGQIHTFNYPSYYAMDRMIRFLKEGKWDVIKGDSQGVRQLLKALYWISEEDRKDHGGFGFGQLISCLEIFTL